MTPIFSQHGRLLGLEPMDWLVLLAGIACAAVLAAAVAYCSRQLGRLRRGNRTSATRRDLGARRKICCVRGSDQQLRRGPSDAQINMQEPLDGHSYCKSISLLTAAKIPAAPLS